MANVLELSVSQLQRVVAIKQKIEELQNELLALSGENRQVSRLSRVKGKKGMPEARKARIAAAARERWARIKSQNTVKDSSGKPVLKDPRFTAAVRAKIAAAAKARWAKAKAAGQTRL